MKSEAQEAGFEDDDWQGIFVLRGQTIDLSAFTISVDERGEITSPGPTLSTSTHLAPYWLKAAVKHAIDAERFSHLTNKAFQSSDANRRWIALDREMVSSMQAVACSAFAIDALHAALLKVNPTPEATREAWKRNRTKRSRQIFETLRRSFVFCPKSGAKIQQFLDQLAGVRDKAVHPPSRSRPAEKHPRLPVAIDPTFVLFRARNAIAAVGMTVSLIEQSANAETARSEPVRERMHALKELVRPISRNWRRTKAARNFSTLQSQARDE